MEVGQKLINGKWNLIEEVNNGKSFLIQALNGDVEYIVVPNKPLEEQGGGLLPKTKQLQFSKADGDLYLRKYLSKDGVVLINITEIENSSGGGSVEEIKKINDTLDAINGEVI